MFRPEFFSGNKPVFFIISILLMTTSLKAQENLVPNGSFEEYYQCPQNIGDFYQFVTDWFSPTETTPDYYNSCNTNGSCGVPSNVISGYGYQYAQDGNAYAGINLNADDGYREYIAVKLTKPLNNQSDYRIQLYVSSSDLTDYGSNNIGVFFLEDTTDFGKLNIEIMSGGTPAIILSNNQNFLSCDNIISDTTNWTKISFIYKASSCEQFLIIGNFKLQSETSFGKNNSVNQGIDSYYYIDNVSITEEFENTINFPNVFTPNADGINDNFDLIGLNISSFIVLNRWGNAVFSSESKEEVNWDGTCNDVPCASGVYFYIIEYVNCDEKKIKKTGFIQLVR